MDNILKALYDHFYCQPENIPQEMRIKANHQLLRQRLSKRNRKLVLRIMDDKDLICSDVSLDSLLTDKARYNLYPYRQRMTVNTKHLALFVV